MELANIERTERYFRVLERVPSSGKKKKAADVISHFVL
jgi:hypothetical protein